MDSSGSIGQKNWYEVLNFTAALVKQFEISPDNVQIGVIKYSNFAYASFGLNVYSNEADVVKAISEVIWENKETNTSGGLRVMHENMFSTAQGDRPFAPNIAILITDGEANRDQNLTIPEANKAKDKGIIIFAIGIGSSISQDELKGIASSPPETFVFRAEDFNSLNDIKLRVARTACEVIPGILIVPQEVVLHSNKTIC